MGSMIATPKSLAREFDLDVKWVRKLLRRRFKRKGGRLWEHWTPRDEVEVRRYLTERVRRGK
jgi:hypothetical protein